MDITYVFALFIGTLLWYGIFYFRFANRDIIVELKNSLKKINKDYSTASLDNQEFKEQNIILREKVSELLMKNEDLVAVVSELSRYYYQIKVWAWKMDELSKYLKLPDPEIESKVEKYSSMYDSSDQEWDNDSEKSFF